MKSLFFPKATRAITESGHVGPVVRAHASLRDLFDEAILQEEAVRYPMVNTRFRGNRDRECIMNMRLIYHKWSL